MRRKSRAEEGRPAREQSSLPKNVDPLEGSPPVINAKPFQGAQGVTKDDLNLKKQLEATTAHLPGET